MHGITRTKPLGNPVPAGCRGGKQAGFRDRLRGFFWADWLEMPAVQARFREDSEVAEARG